MITQQDATSSIAHDQNKRDQLRRSLRRRRMALTPAERKQFSQDALNRLLRRDKIRRARHIAFYNPVGSELDVSAALQSRVLSGKYLYLPVLAPGSSTCLLFARWQPDQRWRRNRFGISEPLAKPRQMLRAVQMDLAIVPLVGFDPDGNRLGAGGGFYDRSFAFLRRAPWRPPRLIGIAFECQKVDSLPIQPWDVPLDAIVTEKSCYIARA